MGEPMGALEPVQPATGGSYELPGIAEQARFRAAVRALFTYQVDAEDAPRSLLSESQLKVLFGLGDEYAAGLARVVSRTPASQRERKYRHG